MRGARRGDSASKALLCRKEPRIGVGGTTQERRRRHSHGDRGNEKTRVPTASDVWVMHSGDRGNEKTRVPPASDVWVMHSGDRGNEKTRVPTASDVWVMHSGDRGNEKTRVPPASDVWVMHSGDRGSEKTRVPTASNSWVMHRGTVRTRTRSPTFHHPALPSPALRVRGELRRGRSSRRFRIKRQ